MDRDRNLLFGIFAAQIKGVTPKQIVEAGAAWATDPTISLAERLIQQGALTRPDLELIDRLVDAAVAAHQGNASTALEALGGDAQVGRTFRGSLVLKPSGALDTRPMAYDSAMGGPETVLSTAEEIPGRYSHISEYGRGGMGRVLLVQDEHMGREVALKELLMPKSEWTGPGDSPAQASVSITARFLQEARLTGRLEHPAIVPVYELGRRSNGTLYYTMKLVRGKTLAKVFKESRDLKERLGLLSNFVDLCQAIAYAHSRGVIHRDIKPANVMVGAFGETVVLDWGLAKAKGIEDIYSEELGSTIHNLRLKIKPKSDASPIETRVGEAVGTPNYMPPEQAEGRIADISERSDVYSLGVVLYELLTGRVPFDARSVDQVLWSLINDPVPAILSIEPNAPHELIEVCMKAVSKDPAKRYASAAELAEEIRRFMTGRVVEAYKYSPAQMLRRYYVQHRAMINTVATAASALVLLGVYSYVNIWQARNNERAQRVLAQEAQGVAEAAKAAETDARGKAEHQEYVSQIRLVQAYLQSQRYEQARKTIWATKESLRGLEWSMLLNKSYPDRFLVSSPQATLFGAKYSLDGTRIATVSAPDPPKIYDAQTGELLVTMKASAGSPSVFAFSPDGKHLLTANIEGQIMLWDSTQGTLEREIAAHTGVVGSASYTNDGTEIVSAGADGVVRQWASATGTLHREFNPTSTNGTVSYSPDNTMIVVEGDDDMVRLFDRATLVPRFEVAGSQARISEHGDLLATVVEAKTLALWSLQDGHAVQRLTGHNEAIYSLRFDPKGARLASVSMDRTVRVWDTASGTLLRKIDAPSETLDAFFTADENKLLTHRNDNQLTVWDLVTGNVVATFLAAGNMANMLDLDPSGTRALVTGAQNAFQVWDILQAPGSTTLREGAFNTRRLAALSPDGLSLAANEDEGISVRDTETGTKVKRFGTFSTAANTALAFSPDAQTIVAAPDGFTALVWNLQTDALQCSFQAHDGQIRAAAFSPDGQRIVTGSADHTARLWNAQTGEQMLVFSGHAGAVEAVAFSPDGKTVATGAADTGISLWDAVTGNRLRDLKGHQNRVVSIAFNKTGDRLVSGNWDRTVRVWNLGTGNVMGVLNAHTNTVDRVSFESDDHYLFSSAWDGTTKIWDARTLDLLVDLPNVAFAAVGGNGSLITLGNSYGDAQRWNLPPLAKVALPGGANQTWEQRFEVFRRQENLRNVGRAPQATTTLYKHMAQPSDRVVGRFQDLAKALAGPPATDSGLCVTPAAQSVAALLGIPAGACLTELNGVPLRDANGLADAAAALTAQPPTGSLSLALRVGDSEQELRYTVIAAREGARDVNLAPSEMLEVLRAIQANTELQRGNLSVDPAQHDPALGIQMDSGAELPKALEAKTGIAMQARLVRINDTVIMDFDQAAGVIAGLIAALESKDVAPPVLALSFSEGDFQRLDLRLKAGPAPEKATP